MLIIVCTFVLFSLDHCVVLSSICGFWLRLMFLQAIRNAFHTILPVTVGYISQWVNSIDCCLYIKWAVMQVHFKNRTTQWLHCDGSVGRDLDRQKLVDEAERRNHKISSKVIHINCNIAPLTIKKILQYMLTRMRECTEIAQRTNLQHWCFIY